MFVLDVMKINSLCEIRFCNNWILLFLNWSEESRQSFPLLSRLWLFRHKKLLKCWHQSYSHFLEAWSFYWRLGLFSLAESTSTHQVKYWPIKLISHIILAVWFSDFKAQTFTLFWGAAAVTSYQLNKSVYFNLLEVNEIMNSIWSQHFLKNYNILFSTMSGLSKV